MTRILFGSYEPDIASVMTGNTSYVNNVFPRSDGYGPIKSLVEFTEALPSACLGYFGGTNQDGSSAIFAGTSTHLYRLNATTRAWDDVSKSGGYNVSTGEYWSFTQFGSTVIAVTSNNNPQAFTLGSSSIFADLGGSPPQARNVSVVGDFVVLSSLTSTPNRIHWSGLNDPTFWTVGTNNCDYQDFPDGGFVRGLSGGEYGIVLQDRAIRRMVFSPGSSIIFQFQRVSEDRGIIAPNSIAKAHAATFFLSQDGFYRIGADGQLAPIGANRVDATIFADADLSNNRFMVATADPVSKRIVWAYKSNSNTNPAYLDKMIVYDWSLDKWSPAEINTTYLGPVLPLFTTLESLDAVADIDALPYSLDTYTATVTPSLAAMTRDWRLAFFSGPNVEATMDTPEGTIGDGKRIFVNAVSPITDATSAYVAMESRERLMDARAFDTEKVISTRSGYAPTRSSGRYLTARVRVPAGTNWNYARGIEFDSAQDGRR